MDHLHRIALALQTSKLNNFAVCWFPSDSVWSSPNSLADRNHLPRERYDSSESLINNQKAERVTCQELKAPWKRADKRFRQAIGLIFRRKQTRERESSLGVISSRGGVFANGGGNFRDNFFLRGKHRERNFGELRISSLKSNYAYSWLNNPVAGKSSPRWTGFPRFPRVFFELVTPVSSTRGPAASRSSSPVANFRK